MQHIKQFIFFPCFDISAIRFAVGIKTKQPTPFRESVAGELAGARMSHEVRHHRPSAAVVLGTVRKITREITLRVDAVKTKQPTPFQESVAGELAGARTRDPNIKSVVLYLLSYEFIVPIRGIPRFWWCKCRHYFCYTKIISDFLSPFAANRQLLFPETCFV